jgi:hypothetical protein
MYIHIMICICIGTHSQAIYIYIYIYIYACMHVRMLADVYLLAYARRYACAKQVFFPSKYEVYT